jgi:hypothetical protein
MTEQQLRAVLGEYLDLLQTHPTAEAMMEAIVTDDFETGFEDGFRWRGPEGLRDFLAAREPFSDERHVVRDVLQLELLSDQIVEGFEDLNPAAERLFATPAEGLNS